MNGDILTFNYLGMLVRVNIGLDSVLACQSGHRSEARIQASSYYVTIVSCLIMLVSALRDEIGRFLSVWCVPMLRPVIVYLREKRLKHLEVCVVESCKSCWQCTSLCQNRLELLRAPNFSIFYLF